MPANNGKGLVGRAVQVEGEGGRVYRGGGVGTVIQKREVWACGCGTAEKNRSTDPLYFQDSVCLGAGPKMSQCVSVEMMNSDKKIKQTV